MRRQIQRRENVRLNKDQGTLMLCGLCFLCGLVLGSLSVSAMDRSQLDTTTPGLLAYMQHMGNVSASPRADVLATTLFKQGKMPVAIWLLAFAPGGTFAALLLLAVKGGTLGFTAALLHGAFGMSGLGTFLATTLPQNVLAVAACFFTAGHSIRFSTAKKDRRLGYQNPLPAYGFILVQSILLVLLAVFAELLLSPILINIFKP